MIGVRPEGSMNDPHVDKVYYSLVTSDSCDFNKAAPVEFKTDHFNVKLDREGATFTMKTHCKSRDEACSLIVPFIESWVILSCLQYDYEDFNLKYKSCDTIDRNPPKSDARHVDLSGHISAKFKMNDKAELSVSRSSFPKHPQNFLINQDVETMYVRYHGYLQNCEPLQSMAYMCLTVLEVSANGRDKASKKYNIDKKVLSKLGELVSKRGGPHNIRKAPKKDYEPLSQVEKNWINEVTKKLILRVGEYNFNPKKPLPKIVMSDLPILSS